MNLRVIFVPPTDFGELDTSKVVDELYFNRKPLDMGIVSVVLGFSNTIGEAINQNDHPDTVIVIIQDHHKDYFGYCYPPTRYSTYNPVIFLACKKIARFGPFKNIMGRWILKHELGHARGLVHCSNLFCIMAKPNISFGRFCSACTRKLE